MHQCRRGINGEGRGSREVPPPRQGLKGGDLMKAGNSGRGILRGGELNFLEAGISQKQGIAMRSKISLPFATQGKLLI